MKLLKLVYIAYGWSLAVLNDRFFDEPIYAWPHGPVIRSLYDEFKHFRKSPIEGRAVEIDFDSWTESTPRVSNDDEETLVVLDKVWELYSPFSAWSLRNKTHEPNSPWSQVYQANVRDIEIPDDLIQQHFEERIRQYLNAA